MPEHDDDLRQRRAALEPRAHQRRPDAELLERGLDRQGAEPESRRTAALDRDGAEGDVSDDAASAPVDRLLGDEPEVGLRLAPQRAHERRLARPAERPRVHGVDRVEVARMLGAHAEPVAHEPSESAPGGTSPSNCGSSSVISCQVAFELTQKCDSGRRPGSPSSVPSRMRKVSGSDARRL